jgi:uncharacterized protein YkwD
MLTCLTFCSCKKEEAPVENVPKEMLAAVNKLRASGCTCDTIYMPPVPLVKWNNDLEAAAAAYAKEMYVNNFFAHIAPDGSSPIQRDVKFGFTGSYIGENIGQGYNDVQQVMTAWQNSQDHCLAMMDSTYVELGAARYNNIWVQEFGGF